MPQRACVVCGSAFTAQRATARYCSQRCRKQGSLRGGAKALAAAGGALDVLPRVARLGGVYDAVALELRASGVFDSALGQMALRLALEVDSGETPPAAKSGLVKELRVVHSAALASGAKVETAQDAILARVVGKLRAV